VVDPVEELFQVDIHHDVMTGRDQLLRPSHRLMPERFGRKPKLCSENVGSHSACRTCKTAC